MDPRRLFNTEAEYLEFCAESDRHEADVESTFDVDAFLKAMHEALDMEPKTTVVDKIRIYAWKKRGRQANFAILPMKKA